MSHMMIIIQKELSRFFGDKRLVFTTVIMPGLMIFLMYTLLGESLMKDLTTEEDYVASAYVINGPAELAELMESLPVDWEVLDAELVDQEEILRQVAEGETDGVLVFPEDFLQKMDAYEVGQGAAPNIEIYHNTAESDSSSFFHTVKTFLNAFEESRVNKFDINAGEGSLGSYDQASDKSMLGKMMASMFPMLIMTFIYSGCAAVAPESIAGEKERGTIATLLVTPVKRSALALGKVVSLSFIALLAGISSFLGTILSLPKMMGGDVDMNAMSYGLKDYFLLFLVILSTVLVLVAMISLISATARSIKEATTAIAPFVIVIILLSLLPMFGMEGLGAVSYCIPLYNSVMTMNGIFGFETSVWNALITVAVNILAAGGLTGVLTRLFNSEKIMFDK